VKAENARDKNSFDYGSDCYWGCGSFLCLPRQPSGVPCFRGGILSAQWLWGGKDLQTQAWRWLREQLVSHTRRARSLSLLWRKEIAEPKLIIEFYSTSGGLAWEGDSL